jgi:hypothetical protein
MERVYGSSATAGAQYDYVHDGIEKPYIII